MRCIENPETRTRSEFYRVKMADIKTSPAGVGSTEPGTNPTTEVAAGGLLMHITLSNYRSSDGDGVKKPSGIKRVSEKAAKLGLTVRPAILFKGRRGCGYMFERHGVGVHWCHSIKQCEEFLKEQAIGNGGES